MANKIFEITDQRDIEQHFRQYVSAAYQGLKPEQLQEPGRSQIEMAFYAGWGQLLVCQRDFVADFESEDEAADLLEKWVADVTNKLKELTAKIS